MSNLFWRIVKGGEDQLLFEEDLLAESGRLTPEGSKLFIDLLFLGKTQEEARVTIIREIKKQREECNK